MITAVVGESGSGKTTLARLLLGETGPTSGAVRYLGKDLRALSRQERRAFRRDVQVIFQDPYEVYNPFYQGRSRPGDADHQVRAGEVEGAGAGADGRGAERRRVAAGGDAGALSRTNSAAGSGNG